MISTILAEPLSQAHRREPSRHVRGGEDAFVASSRRVTDTFEFCIALHRGCRQESLESCWKDFISSPLCSSRILSATMEYSSQAQLKALLKMSDLQGPCGRRFRSMLSLPTLTQASSAAEYSVSVTFGFLCRKSLTRPV